MKRIAIYTTVWLLLAANYACADMRFDSYWYDGNAEISVYDLEEVRYDEVRKGKRIMVFVTEPLRRSTLIKPDTLISADERYDVIKLNDIRKFTTGIYDYSLMTSVFSCVKAYDSIAEMMALKVSFGSQEWCGNVFEIIKWKNGSLKGNLYSYFESDGEPVLKFKEDMKPLFEDNLWILIRELNGPFLVDNSKRSFAVIPSAWQRRKQHVALKQKNAVIEKHAGAKINTSAGRFESVRFVWTIDAMETKVWVEKAWPHKILKWIEPDGSRGSLISSTRQPYWRQHANDDSDLRRRLWVD